MSLLRDAVHASGNEVFINAYNTYGASMEAVAAAVIAAGPSADPTAMRDDPQINAAFRAGAQSGQKTGAIGWAIDGGLFIGGVRIELWGQSYTNPGAGWLKMIYEAFQAGLRVGIKTSFVGGQFVYEPDQLIGMPLISTWVGISAPLIPVGTGVYFFTRPPEVGREPYAGYLVNVSLGQDTGIAVGVNGTFRRG